MLKIPLLRLAGAASLVAIAAAFAPASRDDVPPPDLCGVAASLNEEALTRICGDIRYIGHGTFPQLGVIPSDWSVLPAFNPAVEGRDELAAARHFFEYDAFVLTVRSDSLQHLDMVLRTAAALNRVKSGRESAYRFLTSMMVYPTAPSLDTLAKSRFEKIIISFDKTPVEIAAGTTLEGKYRFEAGEKVYDHYAIISIDEVTIRGATNQMGSGLIYGLPSPAENYRTYMADGIIYSLMHEASHRYVDHLWSTNALAHSMYHARSRGSRDAEEVVANETAISFVGDMISPEMRRHVMQLNTGFARSSTVREWLSGWNAHSGTSGSHLVFPDVALIPPSRN